MPAAAGRNEGPDLLLPSGEGSKARARVASFDPGLGVMLARSQSLHLFLKQILKMCCDGKGEMKVMLGVAENKKKKRKEDITAQV